MKILQKSYNLLTSYWTTLALLALLGIGAAVATFIENDYGTSSARVLVYNALWYELALILTTLNMMGVIYKRKMWKQKVKFMFHFAFVVILLGAGTTRYLGYEGIMSIHEGETTNKMISLEPYLQITIEKNGKYYYKEYAHEFGAIGDNNFTHNIKFENDILKVQFIDYLFAKKGKAKMGLTNVDLSINESKIQRTRLVGIRGMQGVQKTLKFENNTKITIEYGSKTVSLPFSIKLNDFILERYVGNNAPSTYKSLVTLIDEKNNIEQNHSIYMNQTLSYDNFLFFQSSYDPDEKGTVLSVNNDPGKIPTYFGYFLLFLGLILNLFDKKSRFSKLGKFVRQHNSLLAILFVTCCSSVALKADMNTTQTIDYLKQYKANSLETANLFGTLFVQANNGRTQPLDTLNKDIVNKLHKSSSFMGMNYNQIILGMIATPQIWKEIKFIKVNHPKIKKMLGIDKKTKYISFSQAFKNDAYIFADAISTASQTPQKERGTFDKNIIKLDEKLNIAYLVFYGDLFKIFPTPDQSSTKWLSPADATDTFTGQDKDAISKMISGLIYLVEEKNYKVANTLIDLISKYQQKTSIEKLNFQKGEFEIFLNQSNLFPKLTLAYILIGLIILMFAFLAIFNDKMKSKKINYTFILILGAIFFIQTIAMGFRWYVSGHAPWSNTYESLIYIGYSSMFAGLFFFRKSLLALSAATIMTAIFMFTAHLSHIDPQITNLVPVLKSYWLTIHVSIITGSYGFLGVGAMLGFLSMVLFIFRNPSRPNIDKNIYYIVAISEMALIIGLTALVIGNFMGGIWANESWGRYWGWDPKETWAYISIVFYVFVLHTRLIPKLNTPYIYSVLSTVAFGSILMTYFGVNFYLSGLHSYATGDPVPIPTWVYVLLGVLVVIIGASARKKNLPKATLK